MTDFRALCAELLKDLEGLSEGDKRAEPEAWTRARSALAHPEPQGPTDEEIEECFFQRWWFNGGSAIRPHKSG